MFKIANDTSNAEGADTPGQRARRRRRHPRRARRAPRPRKRRAKRRAEGGRAVGPDSDLGLAAYVVYYHLLCIACCHALFYSSLYDVCD